MAEKPAAEAYTAAGLRSMQQWLAWGGRGWLGTCGYGRADILTADTGILRSAGL